MRTPILAATAAVLVLTSPLFGAPADTPAAVKKTVEGLLGKSARISKEGSGANLVYEASVKTELELVLDAAGTVKETEVGIPVGVLPSAVARGVKAKLPKGATIREAEVIITDAGVTFEVEARVAGGKEIEYRVDAAGTVLSEETEDGDEDGDDDDDKDATP